MRLNNVVDDRRDPWTSTDAAARHLRDDYTMLGDWPLAITAYNHGRNGISRALYAVCGTTLMVLITRFDCTLFFFASTTYSPVFLSSFFFSLLLALSSFLYLFFFFVSFSFFFFF